MWLHLFHRNDYEDSKSTTAIKALSALPKSLKANVLSCNDSISARANASQALADAVCKSLKISRIKILVKDSHQLFRNKKGSSSMHLKILGRCWKGSKIEIWNKTAKRQKVVSIKTFYGTLLHELMHHIDWEHFHFANSPHTSGFYKRISYLDQCFKIQFPNPQTFDIL